MMWRRIVTQVLRYVFQKWYKNIYEYKNCPMIQSHHFYIHTLYLYLIFLYLVVWYILIITHLFNNDPNIIDENSILFSFSNSLELICSIYPLWIRKKKCLQDATFITCLHKLPSTIDVCSKRFINKGLNNYNKYNDFLYTQKYILTILLNLSSLLKYSFHL